MKYIIGFILGFLVCSIFSIYQNKPITDEDFMCSSIKEASKDFNKFVERKGLNRSDFKGPYVRQTDSPDPPTFTTCYKSNSHYFCYNQGSVSSSGKAFSEISCDNPTCQWLKSLP